MLVFAVINGVLLNFFFFYVLGSKLNLMKTRDQSKARTQQMLEPGTVLNLTDTKKQSKPGTGQRVKKLYAGVKCESSYKWKSKESKSGVVVYSLAPVISSILKGSSHCGASRERKWNPNYGP